MASRISPKAIGRMQIMIKFPMNDFSWALLGILPLGYVCKQLWSLFIGWSLEVICLYNSLMLEQGPSIAYQVLVGTIIDTSVAPGEFCSISSRNPWRKILVYSVYWPNCYSGPSWPRGSRRHGYLGPLRLRANFVITRHDLMKESDSHGDRSDLSID